MKLRVLYGMLVISLLMLSGCGRIIDWSKEHFNQAHTIKHDMGIVRNYIRSISIHNQLQTSAIFDALLITDTVRAWYAHLYSLKHGFSREEQALLFKHQQEEGSSFITFYVLSLYEVPLADTAADWTLLLSIDGNLYEPIEIKAINLSPEWQAIFGKLFTRFKQAHLVNFDAYGFSREPLINDQVKTISLHFRSVTKEGVLTWPLIHDTGTYEIKRR